MTIYGVEVNPTYCQSLPEFSGRPIATINEVDLARVAIAVKPACPQVVGLLPVVRVYNATGATLFLKEYVDACGNTKQVVEQAIPNGCWSVFVDQPQPAIGVVAPVAASGCATPAIGPVAMTGPAVAVAPSGMTVSTPATVVSAGPAVAVSDCAPTATTVIATPATPVVAATPVVPVVPVRPVVPVVPVRPAPVLVSSALILQGVHGQEFFAGWQGGYGRGTQVVCETASAGCYRPAYIGNRFNNCRGPRYGHSYGGYSILGNTYGTSGVEFVCQRASPVGVVGLAF
uniref:Uncharacterized protein n=1 Tax=Mycena chlorophos TaxID=658473 RepID=A0ABQ0LBK5_MYCCL|nr:predicted protein [Mycena chlorophos]